MENLKKNSIRLEQARKYNNLTLMEVAKKFKISYPTLIAYEKYKAIPNANLFRELCKLYRFEPEYIFLPKYTTKRGKNMGSKSKPRVRKTKKSHSTIL